MRKQFKNGKWSWSHFSDQPVPFPVYMLPKAKRPDPHRMKLERRGAWYVVPVLTQEAGSGFNPHSLAGWVAVCPGPDRYSIAECSIVLPSKEKVYQWIDRQPTPRRFALVALSGRRSSGRRA